MFINVIALVALSPQQHQEPASTDIESQWQKYLSRIVLSEKVSLAFDMSPATVPKSTDETFGEFGLDLLAQRTNRVRLEIDGVQVFVRKQPELSNGLNAAAFRLLRTLCDLDDALLKELCTTGVDMAQLPESAMRELLLSLPLEPSACMRVARGESMRVAVDLAAKYSLIDPTSSKGRSGLLLGDRFGAWINSPRSTERGAEHKKVSSNLTRPLKPSPTDGTLDFGGGEVLTLEDVTKKASGAFSTSYFYDSRLKESKYFFAGKFNRKRFEDTVAALLKVVPLTEAVAPPALPAYNDLARQLSQVLGQNPTAYNSLGQLASVTRALGSGELAATSGQFSGLMKDWGLTGRDFDVSLSPVVLLSVFLPASQGGSQVAFRLQLAELGG